MDEAKHEYNPKQVGGISLEDALEPTEVFETLVHDAGSNDGVDEVGVRADAGQCCAKECDSVSQGEGGDELYDISKTSQKEDHPKQKQQVIVSGQHVGCAEPDILHRAAGDHRFAISRRHPMGIGRPDRD